MLTVKRHTLVNALRVAEAIYREDINTTNDKRLATKFRLQADECAKLVNDIEEADQINLID